MFGRCLGETKESSTLSSLVISSSSSWLLGKLWQVQEIRTYTESHSFLPFKSTVSFFFYLKRILHWGKCNHNMAKWGIDSSSGLIFPGLSICEHYYHWPKNSWLHVSSPDSTIVNFISSSVIGKGNEEVRISLLPMSHLLCSPDNLLRNVYTLLQAHKIFVGISVGIILANTVHSTCEIVNLETQSNRSSESANLKILVTASFTYVLIH